MAMVVAGRWAWDTQPPGQGRSTAGDKCFGVGRHWMRGKRGKGRAQDFRLGLGPALCRTRPRESQQGVMTQEPEALGRGLCRKVMAWARDPEAGQAPGGSKASTAHRLGVGKSYKHTESWALPQPAGRVGESAF